jgi:hypothetical protein
MHLQHRLKRYGLPLLRPTAMLSGVVWAAPGPGAGAAGLAVVVSARSPVGTLRAGQVAEIFLGQVGRFPDGGEAVALDQGVGSPPRDEFYAKVTANSPAQPKTYRSKRIFTGRGQPPSEVPNSSAVRRLVATDRLHRQVGARCVGQAGAADPLDRHS